MEAPPLLRCTTHMIVPYSTASTSPPPPASNRKTTPSRDHTTTTDVERNSNITAPPTHRFLSYVPAIGYWPPMGDCLTDRDVDALAWGIEKAREVLSAAPVRDLLGQEVSPGKALSSSDDTIRPWVSFHCTF